MREQLNQRHNQAETVIDFVDDCIVDSEEQDLSTQLLRMQENQLIYLQDHFERYCNLLQVFGFNNAKCDLNLIKSYLFSILVNELVIELTVMKKANRFVSIKFGDIQLLDITSFLGGVTSLDSSLKAHKTNETKGFFPYEWYDSSEKLSNKELPHDSFFNISRSSNPPEKDYDFENLVQSSLSREQAIAKLRMDNVLPTGAENYALMQKCPETMQNVWDNEHTKFGQCLPT